MEPVTLTFAGTDVFAQLPFMAVLTYDPTAGDDSLLGTVRYELTGSITYAGQTIDVPDGTFISLNDGTPVMVDDAFIIATDLGVGLDQISLSGLFSTSREFVDGGVLDTSITLDDFDEDDARSITFVNGTSVAGIELDRFTVSGGDGSGGGSGGGAGGGSGGGSGGGGSGVGDNPNDGTGGATVTGMQTLLLTAMLEGGLVLDGSLSFDASMPIQDSEIEEDEAFFRVEGTLSIDGVAYSAGGTLFTGNDADLTDDGESDDEVFLTLELQGPGGDGSIQIGLESTSDVTSDDGLRTGISIGDFNEERSIVVLGPFVPNGIVPGEMTRFEFGQGGGDDPGLGQGLSVDDAKIVARLYEAGLDRNGVFDLGGLNFWIDERENGLSERDLAFAFINSIEFAESFGPPESFDNRGFVQVLYRNVLNREGEEGGVVFWTGELDRPEVDRADMLLAFAESPENVAGTPLVDTLTEVSPGMWDFV